MNPALHGSVSVDGPYTAYRVTLADPYVTKKSVGGGYDRNGDTTDLERAKQYLRQQKFTVVG